MLGPRQDHGKIYWWGGVVVAGSQLLSQDGFRAQFEQQMKKHMGGEGNFEEMIHEKDWEC
ncbi:hypothetical protein SLEP1_g56047 [Rubroshorea leprosula]|uniref:Uncharacterized protein n=1 Tax=Rubroshorea leprosula TaxID=152421 RepID=A0AAV5MIG2_9ROSI|nr:hypothetical protein SLEP1_g56047 [Rubroshorea leprosula]